MTKKKLFVIDSNAFLFKSYYALPKFTTSKGEEVGAIFGFIRLLFKIKRISNYIVACYDSSRNKRKEIYLEYKSNRKKIEDALLDQIKKSTEVLSLLGVKWIVVDGYEADDVIATIARKFSDTFEIIIVGADKDLMQIVDGNIKIWDGKSDDFFGPDYVKERFGVLPQNICDYLSLVGDSSDNIPGVEGIGPKTASKLLQRYGSIKNILNSNEDDKYINKIKSSRNQIELSLKLLKLFDNLEIDIREEDFFIEEFKKEGIYELARRFEFKEAMKMVESNVEDMREGKEVRMDEILSTDYEYFSIDENCICFENFYTRLNNKKVIPDILKNNRIHKYLYNAKSLMHLFEVQEIDNFDDIYIAYHLVHGGARKPDIERIIYESFGVNPIIKCLYYKDIMDSLNTKIDELGMRELYRDELKLSEVLYKMEKNGIRVDINKFKLLFEEFENEIKRISCSFKDIAKTDINLNSPKQVSDYLFKKLNLKLDERHSSLYRLKTQKYSTTQDVLNILYPYAPDVISLILKHREYSKLKSFIENLIESAINGRIHTTYDQATTATGRLASYNPNLQNIPVKTPEGRKIRECFIPQDGYVLVSFDYSQIDLRVLAHVSCDEKLISSFINDEDVHVKTARSIFGVDDVDDNLRKIAKTINFGIIYGQTPLGLSIEAKIDIESAKKYIENYFKEYSGVKKWIDSIVEFALTNKYVENFMKRRRILNDIDSPKKALREASKRIAINMPIQSGSSDIIKKAMIEIYDKYKYDQNINPLLQIHDELVFEIKENKFKDYLYDIKNIMENSVRLRVPLKVEVKYGYNLKDMEKWV